jgi:hypothetical protein
MATQLDSADHDELRSAFDNVRVLKARSTEFVDLLVPPAARSSIAFDKPDIEPVITGGTPVRWVMSPSKGSCTGYFWSLRNRETLVWESYGEKAAFSLLECDPWVRRYFPQPLQLSYPWIHGQRRYTPDLFVWRGHRPYVIEVKQVAQLADPDYRAVFKFFAAYFAYRNITFQVWDERHLYAPPRFQNARTLLRHRRQPIERAGRIAVLDYLRTMGQATIQDVARIVGGRATIFALILRGWLAIDMTQPLTAQTQVRACVQ